jgi:hypothetical protein
MKRNAFRGQKSKRLPIAWRDTDYAGLRTFAADNFDDRTSDNVFDVEDERAEIDSIVQRMMHDAS